MRISENEAKEWLAEDTSPTLIHIAELKKENPMVYINEAVKVACDALEEIQAYREIGLTPQMVKDLIASEKKAHKIALKNADMLDEYRAIGTVEECREAVETLKKKPFEEMFVGEVVKLLEEFELEENEHDRRFIHGRK